MTAARVILAPEFDRYAGREPPAMVGRWRLVDAGPFELDDKPGRMYVLVECTPEQGTCGRRRYVLRSEWFRGKCGSSASTMCVRCYRRAGKRSLGEARYTEHRAPVLPYARGAR